MGTLGQQQPRRKIEPPRPVQLGSLKSENEGQDPGVRLVPAGGCGWGRPKEDDDDDRKRDDRGEHDSRDTDGREKPKGRETAKPKLGNLSSNKPSVWNGTLSGGRTPWSAVAVAPPGVIRQQRKREEEFPTLGSDANKGKGPDGNPLKKRALWADEDGDFEVPVLAGRLTDISGVHGLRPTVAPPSETMQAHRRAASAAASSSARPSSPPRLGSSPLSGPLREPPRPEARQAPKAEPPRSPRSPRSDSSDREEEMRRKAHQKRQAERKQEEEE